MSEAGDEKTRDDVDPASRAAPGIVRRHRLSTRLWHWVTALTLLVMAMSGMMIFNAHPRLYWGEYGANADPAWLEIGARGESGYLRVGSVAVATTGVLGRWRDSDGIVRKRAFPGWATIPSHYSLADGRRWHLFFAWVLALSLTAYMIRSLLDGHIRRDLATVRRDWSPRHLWHEIKDHARLRFATGAAATRYNSLQKWSYIGVIFVLLPLMILTGLALSPGFDAVLEPYVDLFGGRQSARSLHFIGMVALVAFFVVHIAMVIAAGPINEIRSMITGRYRVPPDPEAASDRLEGGA